MKLRFTIEPASARESRLPVVERAFTYVEVVVSASILLIAVIALFAGFSNGFAIIDTTREDLRATQVLTQKTEAIRLVKWSDLSTMPSSFREYYYPPSVSSGGAGTTYWGTISIGDASSIITGSPSYQNQVRLVTVTVLWTNYNGGKVSVVHKRQMQTLSAMNGMQNYIYGLP